MRRWTANLNMQTNSIYYLQMQSAANKRVRVYLFSSGQQKFNVVISGVMEYSAKARAIMAMDEVLSKITETQAYKKAMTGPQNRWRGESNASLKYTN